MFSFTPPHFRYSLVAVIILFTAINFGCKKNTTGYVDEPLEINSIEITKWFNNYHAVYTPTLDDGRPADYEFLNNWLLERGMFIDYEIVSTTYDIAPDRVEYMRNFLIPNGFGIFGHGHAHDNHDQFDYQGAYQSFKTNFDRIKSYGFTPIAYAYPYGAGKKASTAQALKDSGFLSGRLHQVVFEGYGPCVMAGDEMEPPNWFQIPSLPMQSYEFEQDAYNYVNDAEEFFSHFEPCVEAGGWINSTYHGLGFDGTNGFPIKWGYYHFSEFEKEMLRVRELMDQGILWLAQLSEVTLYAQQRNAANVLLDKIGDNEYEIYLFDGLDRSIYTMPLTLKLELDGNFNGKRLRIVNVQAGFLQEVTINEATILLNLVPSTSPYRVRVL